MNRTVIIPLTSNQIAWIARITFPLMMIHAILSYPNNNIVHEVEVVIGIVGTLTVWIFSVVRWVNNPKFPQFKCKSSSKESKDEEKSN